MNWRIKNKTIFKLWIIKIKKCHKLGARRGAHFSIDVNPVRSTHTYHKRVHTTCIYTPAVEMWQDEWGAHATSQTFSTLPFHIHSISMQILLELIHKSKDSIETKC